MPRSVPFSILVALLSCVFSVHVMADVLTLGSAINKAGRQRMLTQNILKNYLVLGMQVDVVRGQEELDHSVALFDAQFQELQNFAPSQAVKNSLAAVAPLWLEYRNLAVLPPTQDNAAYLLQQNNALLAACHQVVLDLQAFAGRNSAEMVNIAGRQRMLSQRIAAYYLAQAWGFREPVYRETFTRARDEYTDGLQKLTDFESNTADLRLALKRVQAQWQFANTGFDQQADGHYVPYVIVVTTGGMLKQMDQITALYEQLDTDLARGTLVSHALP